MSGNTLPGDLDLLDLVLVSPRPIYVFINGVPTTTPRPTTTTEPPDRHLWRLFDGYSWVMYDLELLPSSYLGRSDREDFEVIFRTSHPDGLIWFTGNERNNMHLTMRVCVVFFSISGVITVPRRTSIRGSKRLRKPLLLKNAAYVFTHAE